MTTPPTTPPPPLAADRLLTATALTSPLPTEPVDPAAVRSGSPTVGLVELTAGDGPEVGIWELGPGEVTDVEVDEVFVVLAGEGRVTFADGSRIELGPGVVVRLHAGDRTVWTVRSPLRKVYVV